MIRLVQVFASVESRDHRPWEESLGLGLASQNGVKVALSKTTKVPSVHSLKHKYLLYSHYPPGHSLNTQGIAKALVSRGHDVTWLVSKENEHLVAASGATFFATHDIASADARLKARNPQTMLGNALERINGRLMDEVADYRRILAKFQPDCVVAGLLPLGARALFELGEIPTYATIGGIAMGYTADGCPQWSSGRTPPSSNLSIILHRLRHRLNEWLIYPIVLGPSINAQRRKLGLPRLPLGLPMEQYTYSPLLNLQASCPRLEYHDIDATDDPSPYMKVQYVGLLATASDQVQVQDDDLPSWWPDVVNHPCVVGATQGTVATDPFNLIIPCIKAALLLPKILLVVTTPYVDDIRARMEIPSNVLLIKYFPYSIMLPRLRILITNGGYRGITQALALGLPLICAGRSSDHIDTAARVSWVGAGIDMKQNSPKPSQIQEAVQRILSDESYKRNARRIGDELLNLGGAEAACDALEDLVSQAREKSRLN